MTTGFCSTSNRIHKIEEVRHFVKMIVREKKMMYSEVVSFINSSKPHICLKEKTEKIEFSQNNIFIDESFLKLLLELQL